MTAGCDWFSFAKIHRQQPRPFSRHTIRYPNHPAAACFVLGQHGVSVLMAVASLRCGRTNPNLSTGPSLRRERPSRQYLSGVWASCISPNGLLLLSINAAQGPEGYHACRDLFITPDGARRMQTAHSESHSRRSGIILDHILEV